jgi:hypothetical protein
LIWIGRHRLMCSISALVPGTFFMFANSLAIVVGIDRPGAFPFWQGLRRLLGVHNVVEHTIRPKEPLPADVGRFDLVTSYRAQFNYNVAEKRLWDSC